MNRINRNTNKGNLLSSKSYELKKFKPEKVINDKFLSYQKKAIQYKWLFYLNRSIGGLSAGILPFIVTNPALSIFSIILSVIIVIITTFDLIFTPKDKWKLYSQACDLILIWHLKQNKKYEDYKDILDTIVDTEVKLLEKLSDLNSLLGDKKEQNLISPTDEK